MAGLVQGKKAIFCRNKDYAFIHTQILCILKTRTYMGKEKLDHLRSALSRYLNILLRVRFSRSNLKIFKEWLAKLITITQSSPITDYSGPVLPNIRRKSLMCGLMSSMPGIVSKKVTKPFSIPHLMIWASGEAKSFWPTLSILFLL